MDGLDDGVFVQKLMQMEAKHMAQNTQAAAVQEEVPAQETAEANEETAAAEEEKEA